MEISRDRLIADTQALVRIQSVNPYDKAPALNSREQECADWLTAQMQDIGLEVSSYEVAPGRPNVWGCLKGSEGGPTLMLAGHMDTVGVEGYEGDPFDPYIEDGKIFGRGSVDMKGPLATFLETARIAKTMELKGDLLLAFVCDEEDKMTGSIAAPDGGIKADFCIVGEPSMLTVCTAHKGQMIWEIEVEGKACHSSNPSAGINAISTASALIEHMAAYNAELATRKGHALCGHGYFTPVLIKGGESHSTVAGGCSVQFDRRVVPGEIEGDIKAEIQGYIDKLDNPAAFKLNDSMPNTLPLDTNAHEPIAIATLAASSRATGKEQKALAFPGGTDAPNFGCPAVICGPGNLAQAHTTREFIEIDQLEKAVDLYLDVIWQLLS